MSVGGLERFGTRQANDMCALDRKPNGKPIVNSIELPMYIHTYVSGERRCGWGGRMGTRVCDPTHVHKASNIPV